MEGIGSFLFLMLINKFIYLLFMYLLFIYLFIYYLFI
jgi:hypothetical protein